MSSKVINWIHKRNKYPVPLGDDDSKAFIRAMLKRENREARGVVDDELRAYFMLGCSLVDEDGSPLYPRNDEAPTVYAQRVSDAMDDAPEDTLVVILNAVNKLRDDPKAMPKN